MFAFQETVFILELLNEYLSKCYENLWQLYFYCRLSDKKLLCIDKKVFLDIMTCHFFDMTTQTWTLCTKDKRFYPLPNSAIFFAHIALLTYFLQNANYLCFSRYFLLISKSVACPQTFKSMYLALITIHTCCLVFNVVCSV